MYVQCAYFPQSYVHVLGCFLLLGIMNCLVFVTSFTYVCHAQHIEASLGSKIRGQLDKTDSGVIFTDSYVARYLTDMKICTNHHE